MKWTNVYGLDQLGSFLRKTRKEKGYTQDEFAEIIGASHATLSALENGKGVSSQTLMRAISDLGLKLVVLPKGKIFVRAVAMQFDRYLRESNRAGGYSRIA